MKKKGYSMLEVMLAFAIFSIALLPLLSSYKTIFKMERTADEREESSRVAINVADYIRAKGYDKLTKATTNGAVTFDLPFKATFEYDSGVWEKDGIGNSFESYFNLGNDGEWFIINSKALKFDNTTITVELDKVALELGGTDNYENPLTGSSTDKYIYTGRTDDTLSYSSGKNEFVVGEVTVNYTNSYGKSKTYDRYRFMVSPIEKWK